MQILACLGVAIIIVIVLRLLKHYYLRGKILQICRNINATIKMKDFLKYTMVSIQETLKAEACTLYIVDEQTNELWFHVTLGQQADKLKKMRIPIGEGSLSGIVAKEGCTLNIKDVRKDTRHMHKIKKVVTMPQKAILTVPVRNNGKIIAVIQAINKKGGGYFTKLDQQLLESATEFIGLSLEKAKLYDELYTMAFDLVTSLASAIDAKDEYTQGHSKRVTEYALMIGDAMNLHSEQMEILGYMAMLHDVGKIGITDSILNKQTALTKEEFEIMKTHTSIGERILTSTKSLSYLAGGAKYHHEKYNGTGYNEKLKGEAIPLEARIIAIADTYDAMTSDRPYRKGLSMETALEEIQKYAGTQFDPHIVEKFVETMQKRKDE